MRTFMQPTVATTKRWFENPQRQSFWDQIGQAAAIAIAFAIPVSTALTSVLAMILLVCWVSGPNHAEKWQILRYHPLLTWIYLLIILAFVGATYSDASAKAIRHGLTDALRLAWIPILFYFYQPEKIGKAALWAFIAAMVLTLFLGFLKVYANFPIGLKLTTAAVFKSHIKTSYFMGMAAFFLALQLPLLTRYRWWIVGLIVAMIYYLFFMSIGRIGYLTVIICAAVLAWQQYRLKGLYIAAAGIILLFAGAFTFSDLFANRVSLLSQDLVIFQQAGDLQQSSLGSRLSFAANSLALIKSHLWLGYGTGSFGAAYASLPEGAVSLMTDNPHNEYLRMGVEYGVFGVLLLLMLFYQQWRLSQGLPLILRLHWQGILFTFIVGCFLNSWLKDFTEGYFFCVMTALCFSQHPLALPAYYRKPVLH